MDHRLQQLLVLGGTASGWLFLYFVLERQRCLALNGLCQVLSCAATTFTSERTLYTQQQQFERLHRARYVVDVCLAPCLLYAVFWPLLTQFPFLLFPLLGAHAHALYFAVPDLLEYPFSPENVLGVLYWKPARCSVRMLAVTRLVARGLVVLVVVRAAELVLGTAGPPSGTTWEEDQRSFWLRLWSLIAAVVAWGVYYAICVMRRGSDNEWSFLYREMAVLGIAGVLI